MAKSPNGAHGTAARRVDPPRLVQGRVTPDINVTPLVDVVLVLLIIFMVVAPRMEQDVPVDLPGIFNPDPEVETAIDPVKVTVAKAGEYFIDEQQYDLDGAIAALAAEHAAEPHAPARAARRRASSPYSDVREILARSQQVGFPGCRSWSASAHRAGDRHGAAMPSRRAGRARRADPWR